MEEPGALVGVFINFGIPIAGVVLFRWLRNRMTDEHRSPVIVFLLFGHYGAWIVVGLTVGFWYWSGMATLGILYLMTAGAVVMLVVAGLSFREQKRSIYHRIAFLAAIAYFLPVVLVFSYVLLLLSIGQE